MILLHMAVSVLFFLWFVGVCIGVLVSGAIFVILLVALYCWYRRKLSDSLRRHKDETKDEGKAQYSRKSVDNDYITSPDSDIYDEIKDLPDIRVLPIPDDPPTTNDGYDNSGYTDYLHAVQDGTSIPRLNNDVDASTIGENNGPTNRNDDRDPRHLTLPSLDDDTAPKDPTYLTPRSSRSAKITADKENREQYNMYDAESASVDRSEL